MYALLTFRWTLLNAFLSEDKLKRLEGSKRRNLTSKDILKALSESRDDHLRQMDAAPSVQLTLSGEDRTTNNDRQMVSNDPWTVARSSAPSESASGKDHHDGLEEYPLDFEDPLVIDNNRTCFSKLFGACRCWKFRVHHGRLQSNLTAEEDEEFLMDCDELSQVSDNV